MFCPKCGSIMRPKSEGAKKFLLCSCGHKSANESLAIKEKIKLSTSRVGVVESEFNVDPKTEAKCPKCNNNEAYYWHIQTRASDEPETKFLKCTKCKHTWRDYK